MNDIYAIYHIGNDKVISQQGLMPIDDVNRLGGYTLMGLDSEDVEQLCSLLELLPAVDNSNIGYISIIYDVVRSHGAHNFVAVEVIQDVNNDLVKFNWLRSITLYEG